VPARRQLVIVGAPVRTGGTSQSRTFATPRAALAIGLKGRAEIARALYVTAKETSCGSEAMTKISDLHRRWSKDADYKSAYDAIGEEFDLARALMSVHNNGDPPAPYALRWRRGGRGGPNIPRRVP
jgi:hypothetical protein